MNYVKSIALFILFLLPFAARTQEPVKIVDSIDQHIFSFKEIGIFMDPNEEYSFDAIKSDAFLSKFQPSASSTPQTLELNTTYWFKIRIHRTDDLQNNFVLEFFDQTIDEITAYIPLTDGNYRVIDLGDHKPFSERFFKHKNFEIPLEFQHDASDGIYYFKVKSSQIADIIIVLRSVKFFVSYALSEYFSFGIFYGMILVFSLYNLVLFAAVRKKQYLFYVLYLLSVSLYEMSSDGIAYHYLWPDSPQWNQLAFAITLISASSFVLLFTRALFNFKDRAPWLDKLILYTIVIRAAFFLYSLFFDRSLFNYKFIEFVPLSVAFFAGLYIYFSGYRAARFFVIGYGFVFIGFIFKLFIMLGISSLNFGVISYYSLSFCFILEMIFFSLAIGDNLRILKREQEKMQKQVLKQMTENVALKDILNRELKSEVRKRNQELEEANILLQEQSEEISRMNELLQIDNQELKHDKQELITNVKKISRDRALSADVDFEEFSAAYPDANNCYEFLAELKWKGGYHCRKCANEQYFSGNTPFSRRCTKCGYDESVTSYTIFHNMRIPINKAFYMIFLVYTTKGKISSHKLSEIVSIRQSTCWSFSNRIKKVMVERKVLKSTDKHGWSQLVLVNEAY